MSGGPEPSTSRNGDWTVLRDGDAGGLAAGAAAEEGFPDAAADRVAVGRAAGLAGPGDGPDLGSDEPVPELKTALHAGPALVNRDPAVLRGEGLAHRGNFVGRMRVEVREPAPQRGVGQSAGLG